MLLTVLDGLGVSQKVVTPGQEAVVDKSGSIGATGVAQDLMVANVNRSGWNFQNEGASDMWINETGVAAAADSPSWKVPAGGYFPPPGFPLTTSKISVIGTIGQKFTSREW